MDGARTEGKMDAWVTQRSLSWKLEAEFRGHVIQHTLMTLPLSVLWLYACDLGR